jgi:hypothetical protein
MDSMSKSAKDVAREIFSEPSKAPRTIAQLSSLLDAWRDEAHKAGYAEGLLDYRKLIEKSEFVASGVVLGHNAVETARQTIEQVKVAAAMDAADRTERAIADRQTPAPMGIFPTGVSYTTDCAETLPRQTPAPEVEGYNPPKALLANATNLDDIVGILANECWPKSFVKDCFAKYEAFLARAPRADGENNWTDFAKAINYSAKQGLVFGNDHQRELRNIERWSSEMLDGGKCG